MNKVEILDIYRYVNKKHYYKVLKRSFYLLDINPTKYIDLNKLCGLLGITRKEVYRMSFLTVITKFTEENENYYFRMLSSFIDNKFYKYCFTCYQENKKIEKIWRIKDINTCEKHKVELIRVCLKCVGKVFSNTEKSKSNCGVCGKSLIIPYVKSEISNGIWEFLVSDKTLITKKFKGFSLSKSIALLFLYVTQNQPKVYSPSKTFGLSLTNAYTLAGYIRDKNNYYPNLINLLDILSSTELDIDLNSLYQVVVNESFIKSITQEKSKEINKDEINSSIPICNTQWCRYKGKSEKIIEYRSFKKRGVSPIFICLGCFIKLRKQKEGNFVDLDSSISIISNTLEKLNNGVRKKDLNLSCTHHIQRIVGYGVRFGLLKNKLHQFEILDEKLDTQRLKNLIKLLNSKEVESIYSRGRELYSWRMDYFYYLYYSTSIQTLLIQTFKHPSEGRFKNNIKIEDILLNMLEEEKNITYQNLCIKTGLTDMTLRKHFSDIISSYQKEQKERRYNKTIDTVWSKVKKYVEECNENQNKILLMDVYKIAGKSISWLNIHIPNLSDWVKEEIKKGNYKKTQLVYDCESYEKIL